MARPIDPIVRLREEASAWIAVVKRIRTIMERQHDRYEKDMGVLNLDTTISIMSSLQGDVQAAVRVVESAVKLMGKSGTESKDSVTAEELLK